MKKILNFILGKTVYDQEEDYIKKNGYPDEDVIFTDKQGRMSKIIGKNTFLKNIKLFDKIKK